MHNWRSTDEADFCLVVAVVLAIGRTRILNTIWIGGQVCTQHSSLSGGHGSIRLVCTGWCSGRTVSSCAVPPPTSSSSAPTSRSVSRLYVLFTISLVSVPTSATSVSAATVAGICLRCCCWCCGRVGHDDYVSSRGLCTRKVAIAVDSRVHRWFVMDRRAKQIFWRKCEVIVD